MARGVSRSSAFIVACIASLAVGTYYAKKRAISSVSRKDLRRSARGEKKFSTQDFRKQIKFLLKIVLPTWRCREALILGVHTSFLFARTFLSLYVAWLDGALVKALVSRKLGLFIHLLLQWIVVSVPSSVCNSMIKYLESSLATSFRNRLSEYSLKQYMHNEVYYRVLNMDDRVSNADQRLTEDVSNFCDNLAHVHSQLSKPLLDVLMSSINLIAIGRQGDLRRGAGFTATTIGTLVIYVSGSLLRAARPPLGALVARQAALEGDLRHVHARLIGNAEQIGFYRGHRVELGHLLTAWHNLRKHQQNVNVWRVPYGALESFLMKYVWSAAGLVMLAVPAFFFERHTDMSSEQGVEVMSKRTGDFVTGRKLLLTAADAIERMMLAFKEISQLAGYTSRVYEALVVFDEVGRGQYVKHATVSAEDNAALDDSTITLDDSVASEQQALIHPDSDADVPLLERRGVLREADFVAFEKVPIVTPNGDLLVSDMTFCVRPGDHVLIAGPNGCGKSSLFRILGGLWPVHGGLVKKPAFDDMFYIPQQPYMTLGTLREQVIYPDTLDDFHANGHTDDELMAILETTHTAHVARREAEGFDTVRDWKSALSGGLLQRVGMARVLYHKPKFAILDECTSAVSIDVEGSIYQHMIDQGITLLTVTHRPTLWKYHKFLLQFDGEGGFIYRPMDQQTMGQVRSLSAERTDVAEKIKSLQQRLESLDSQLAVVDD